MPILLENNKDTLDQFYRALTSTSNSLGLSQLWLVGFNIDRLRNIANIIMRDINKYESNNNNWDIINSLTSLVYPKDGWFLGDYYCLLAQSTVFPGDSISVTRAGVGQTGALKGLIGEQRNDLPTVTITFLETNQSIADVLFRPWAILTGYKSLKNDSLRMPIDLICLQKTTLDRPLAVRKQITLQRAVPISIDSEEYNYTGDKVIYRQIEFAYDKYYVLAQQGTFITLDNMFNGPRSFFDVIRGIVDTAAGIYGTVQSKVENIQAATTQAMRGVGLDKLANKTDKVFNDAKENVLHPVGDVISTGMDVVGGIEAAGRLGREFTDFSGGAQPNWVGEIEGIDNDQQPIELLVGEIDTEQITENIRAIPVLLETTTIIGTGKD